MSKKISRRSSLLATLVALILAPFQRFFDSLKPKPKGLTTRNGYFVEFGPDRDSNEPFSVSMWFKTPAPDPNDKSYLFDLKGPSRKISETTLLDDIDEDDLSAALKSWEGKDGWHHMVCVYEGGSTKDLEIFVDGRPLGAPPLPPNTIMYFDPPGTTLPTLAAKPRRTVYKALS